MPAVAGASVWSRSPGATAVTATPRPCQGTDRRMLFQRVATSAVGLPIVVALVWAGGGWYAAAASLILALATLEFETPVLGWRHPLAITAAALSAGLAAGALVGQDWLVWFATGAVLIPLAWVALAGGEPRDGVPRW